MIIIEKDVNEKLGYELFNKLIKESLVVGIEKMYKHTLKKSKFLKESLEKAVYTSYQKLVVTKLQLNVENGVMDKINSK